MARKINAEVILGDRPISVTLQRAWDAMSLADCAALLTELLPLLLLWPGAANQMRRKFVLENAASSTSVADWTSSGAQQSSAQPSMRAQQQWRTAADNMLTRPKSELFPTSDDFSARLQEPLVHERDRFLAWTLKRSRAVSCKSVIVGVVGMGHLQGVMHYLAQEEGSPLLFQDVAGRRLPELRGGKAAAACRWLLLLACTPLLVGAVNMLLQSQALNLCIRSGCVW